MLKVPGLEPAAPGAYRSITWQESGHMSTYQYGANIRANGIRQHYLRYGGKDAGNGKNDPVIIVPGITSPAITWGFVGERFGRNFDTYILDVRGRGLSEASDGIDYSLDAQAADVLGFAKALGLDRFAIVGHSMGARIGTRAAGSKPAGLTRLVLIDPPVSGPGRRAYPAKLPWYVDSMRLAREGTDAEGMRPFCPTWTEEQLQLRAEWLHTCNEGAVIRSFEDFHTDDIHADLPRVAVPALLIQAGRGDVIREEDVAEMRGLLPSLQVARVANAGHMIPCDDEEGFYRAFGDFLGAPIIGA
ncbi:MAG: hydrolase or acyltransferase alpha/beta hydrolase superfamily [Noviherbaspirillum sp.]|nr:hydrolase or acyltransferase alpha/beta hydrolase superfamily [Noviherbaspirillum sp.]